MSTRITLTPDRDLDNADWTKTAWDLPVHSVAALRTFLERSGMTVAQFKRLPVYQHNVRTLPWLKGL